jgi:hypothetical protein
VKLPCILALVATVAATPVAAHHSVYGAFDKDRPMNIRGVVKKLDWINPHTFFTVDVTDAQGKVKTWRLESQPPAFLRRAGLSKEQLQGDGKPVDLVILPARKAGVDNIGFLVKMTMSDGKAILFAPDK